MSGWHHQCNGHELGQISGDGEGQGGLLYCSPWRHRQLDMTGQLSKNQMFPVLITLKEPQVLVTVAGPISLFPFRHQENVLGAH